MSGGLISPDRSDSLNNRNLSPSCGLLEINERITDLYTESVANNVDTTFSTALHERHSLNWSVCNYVNIPLLKHYSIYRDRS